MVTAAGLSRCSVDATGWSDWGGWQSPREPIAAVAGKSGVEETLWENTNASSFGVLLVCHPRLPSWNTPQSKEFGVDYFQPSAFTLSCTKRKSWLGKPRHAHKSESPISVLCGIRPLIFPQKHYNHVFNTLVSVFVGFIMAKTLKSMTPFSQLKTSFKTWIKTSPWLRRLL